MARESLFEMVGTKEKARIMKRKIFLIEEHISDQNVPSKLINPRAPSKGIQFPTDGIAIHPFVFYECPPHTLGGWGVDRLLFVCSQRGKRTKMVFLKQSETEKV